MAGAGRDIESLQVRHAATIVAVGLQDDIVFLAALDVGGGATRSEHGLQRAADLLRRHAQGGRLLRIDINQKARRVRFIIEARTREAGVLLRRRQDGLQPVVDRPVFGARHDHFDGVGIAAAALEGARGRGVDLGVRLAAQLAVQFLGDLVGRAAALRPVGQVQHPVAGVVAAAAEAGRRH
ncbi:hypothetical protein D3C81_1547530 [compost metagenome]